MGIRFLLIDSVPHLMLFGSSSLSKNSITHLCCGAPPCYSRTKLTLNTEFWAVTIKLIRIMLISMAAAWETQKQPQLKTALLCSHSPGYLHEQRLKTFSLFKTKAEILQKLLTKDSTSSRGNVFYLCIWQMDFSRLILNPFCLYRIF